MYFKDQETIINVWKIRILRKLLRQRWKRKSAKKERILRSRSPTFANGAHLALFFDKMSGALGALARKRAALTHALVNKYIFQTISIPNEVKTDCFSSWYSKRRRISATFKVVYFYGMNKVLHSSYANLLPVKWQHHHARFPS